ncbi:hypothetical protein [Sphaerisporangium sp. TRM90804]|uniref:hypothetical protein n=1 Tax=Sphaerisporangium sp. TRM90804 TaxID=3031113 RepID=UPI0024477CCF|nr:hypothetical protein [Sphaerisporangium sp. TRM90804]MDH2425782.1 hypothetical protein [Sphaerisporangium sp. TRM90804]
MADKSEKAGDKVRARVVGTCEVAGTAPGGTVDLDPEQVNVPALVEAGHIEISKSAAERLTAPSAPES